MSLTEQVLGWTLAHTEMAKRTLGDLSRALIIPTTGDIYFLHYPKHLI